MNNRTHSHLTEEELFALTEFRFELLSDAMQEVSQCESCMKQIAHLHIFDMHLRNVSTKAHGIPSPKRLEEMTDKAFSSITTVSETASETDSQPKRSFIPVLTSIAATLLVAIGLYHYMTPAHSVEQKQIQTAGNKADNILRLTQEDHLFAQDSVITEGVTTLTLLENSTIKKESDQHFIIKEGKVRFKVVSGNNTLIHINSEFLVRVLGTEFIVSAHNHHLDVSVIEGLVEVVHLGTGEIKTVAKDEKCHYKFITPIKPELKRAVIIKPRIRQKLIAPPLLKPVQMGTYLEQGRIALEKGETEKALRLFNSALHQKTGADKALFEIIRIYEGKKEYRTILSYLTKHKRILEEYKTYREEFLIKGCNAQSGIKSKNLSFCTHYLKLFPEGYKRPEIEKLLGVKK
ncbi:FecR domain-containing protein [bacterium]|nr:FecR domain-containing protein [bacterium]